jgi:Na+-transporting methylmalonyl-CoA/oxaloacetate decarboxylase gamma subunit
MSDIQAVALGLGTVLASLFILRVLVRTFSGGAKPPEPESEPESPAAAQPEPMDETTEDAVFVAVMTAAIAAFEAGRRINPTVRNFRTR